MGPSGCGKSTLLNLVGMLDTPTRGQYVFEGTDISGYSESQLAELRKRRLGFIFQSFNLIDDLTVRENIELALLYQRVDGRERTARVDEIMDRVGIAHRARHRPPQLSGGQQQRVAVARALVGRPALILADEPTGNLDSAHGTDVMQMLRGLNEEGTTILMVTHSLEHADYARRIVNMLDGRILTERRALAVPQAVAA
jgi:putative ABC transport system ATP-binding protein